MYDAALKSVSATIAPGAQATLKVVSGAIHFGAAPVACGAATTTNTNSITISGAGGTVETLALDMSGGAFAPGATAESGTSEIEITALLGDTTDVVVVHGTPGNDVIRMGSTGMGLHADSDRDVTFTPLPTQVEIFGDGGEYALWGRGPDRSVYTGKVILHAGDSVTW
jgi:hypothetical protein